MHQIETPILSSADDEVVEQDHSIRSLIEIALCEQHLVARRKKADHRDLAAVEAKFENTVAKILFRRVHVTVAGLQIDVAGGIGCRSISSHPDATVAPIRCGAPDGLERKVGS